jgi:hypothetical protein
MSWKPVSSFTQNTRLSQTRVAGLLELFVAGQGVGEDQLGEPHVARVRRRVVVARAVRAHPAVLEWVRRAEADVDVGDVLGLRYPALEAVGPAGAQVFLEPNVPGHLLVVGADVPR